MNGEDVDTVRSLADPWTEGRDLTRSDIKSICRVLIYLLDKRDREESYKREQGERS